MVRLDGQKLRNERRRRLIERKELARKAGCSYSTLYKMERHGHLPRLGTVRAVAEVLRIDPYGLLIDTEELALSSSRLTAERDWSGLVVGIG